MGQILFGICTLPSGISVSDMMSGAAGGLPPDRETGLTMTTRGIRLVVTAGLVVLAALAINNRNQIAAQAPGSGASPDRPGPSGRRSQPGNARPESGLLSGRRRTNPLMVGLLVCALGLLFGLVILYTAQEHAGACVDAGGLRTDLRDLQDVPDPTGQTAPRPRTVHRHDHRVLLRRPAHFSFFKVAIILFFSLVGIAGSFGVAWFGIRVNTFANSRTAFASLRGKPQFVLCDSAQGRHEHRHDADQRRTAADAVHPAVHSRRLRWRLSSGSPLASRWARRRCESPAASS